MIKAPFPILIDTLSFILYFFLISAYPDSPDDSLESPDLVSASRLISLESMTNFKLRRGVY